METQETIGRLKTIAEYWKTVAAGSTPPDEAAAELLQDAKAVEIGASAIEDVMFFRRRAVELEFVLEEAAKLLQPLLPLGQAKDIRLKEVPEALRQLIREYVVPF